MDRAGCAISCGRPWYSRGAQNRCSVCSAHKPPARCGQAESSDCKHEEQGNPRKCVSPELISSGEPSSFVAAARASLPARCGHAHSGYRHTYVTATSNSRNESDLLCWWPQEDPSVFVSSCQYPESDADFGISSLRLFPVVWSIYSFKNSLHRQPIPQLKKWAMF
jgi:hypothetical protein